jgi:hypothetical protein
MDREWMHLDAFSALFSRKLHDELKAVDILLSKREDEAERSARSPNRFEVSNRTGESAFAAADEVMLGGPPID